MAIFHLHVKHIGKSNNRSAVAASAYCSASKLMEESMDSSTGARCAITHNYTHKAGVVFSRIFTPEKASLWMGDREALWNLVQNRFDTRKNAVYAQEIDIALPVELSLEANKELVCEFVETVLVNEGMIADVNIHMDDIKNPHAHIMMSTREIIPGEGEDYIFGKKVRYWDSREFLVHVRRMWAASINKYLLINGFDIEVSHLSYAQRGLSIIPSVKEGVKTTIIGSRRVQKNNNIKLQNIERIRNSPDLLIDMLRRNKAAFTRDEIVRELSKFYDAHGADASEFMRALSHVMSSKKLVMLNSRNLEGELLYTDRQRFELEEDFLKIVNRLCNEKGDSKYNLGIEFQDLEEESKFQQLRKTALKKIGFERNHPKLSDKQKQVALGILNGGMVSVLEGLPGAGKTSVMREVVFQYK